MKLLTLRRLVQIRNTQNLDEMSILINTISEQEEKILTAFLDSLSIQYKTDIDESLFVNDFITTYNSDLDKANAEIEAGNFISHEDVALLFNNRRQAVK